MTYFISPEKEYPRHIGDVQIADPNWDGDFNALPEGWTLVHDIDAPIIQAGQELKELEPELIDGVYKRVWQVIDLTPEEIAERELNYLKWKASSANLTTEDMQKLLQNTN